jgi:hypothetical protein
MFQDALKGMEAARKYMYQCDTENWITVMCNKVENEFADWECKEKRTNGSPWLIEGMK